MSPEARSAVSQKLARSGFGNIHSITSVGGGSVNAAYRIDTEKLTLFCKVNSASRFPNLFASESKGLQLIASRSQMKTPEIFACFEEGGHQFLIMEWIPSGSRTNQFWSEFGASLAAMHQVKGSGFGLETGNYMGSVPQSNAIMDNWIGFFISQRLVPMTERCASSLTSRHHRSFENLFKKLPSIFEETSAPVLVHGDLWNGNYMCNAASEPVLIDPAVYYGHSAVDLGMTTLFGGFPPAFYDAYNYHSPFSSNYKEQWSVCNLYPLLIHLYLFGEGYLPQIEQTLEYFA